MEIYPLAAAALDVPVDERDAIAARLAEIAQLPSPARDETRALLVEVFVNGLSAIPATSTAWSWGEFYNCGAQPLYDIDRAQDWERLALCAIDLGLDDRVRRLRRDEQAITPRAALMRNLSAAVDDLIRAVSSDLRQPDSRRTDGIRKHSPSSTGPRNSVWATTVQIVEDERLGWGDPRLDRSDAAAVVAEARPEGGP